jgi:hypothetical protein
MPEATEYTELTIYGIGRSQRECHGHGDFSDETAIRKIFTGVVDNVWNEDFPPFFLTEREALEFVRSRGHYETLAPVKLRLRMKTAQLQQAAIELTPEATKLANFNIEIMKLPEKWRERWCTACICSCIGCANKAGRLESKGYTHENYIAWCKLKREAA